MDNKQHAAAGTRLASKREVLSLENEALGRTDIDHDRVRERAFCSPGLLQELIDDAQKPRTPCAGEPRAPSTSHPAHPRG